MNQTKTTYKNTSLTGCPCSFVSAVCIKTTEKMILETLIISNFCLSPVQIPNKHRRHCGGVSAAVPPGRRQRGLKAGLELLRALLQRAPAVGALHPDQGGPRRPAGKDPVGS